jgi:DMSO/TMAO reductase YedYZ molybdopterin-dependent catalytic subunit
MPEAVISREPEPLLRIQRSFFSARSLAARNGATGRTDAPDHACRVAMGTRRRHAPRVDDKKIKSIVERKQAFAERQLARGRGVFAGREPQGTGPANRHGLPRLPVGQHEVTKWPVLDLGDLPDVDQSTWRLEIDGLVESPQSLGWDDFLALPQTDDVSDFHCVTSWSRMDNHWRGVRFADLAALARPRPEARHILITALDSEPNFDVPYTTNLSLEEALQPDVMLVHTWEGEPLPHEHGGPVRMITPQLYAWKGAKWIQRITFLEHDKRGFWERNGYSNTAYPWFDDRYSH